MDADLKKRWVARLRDPKSNQGHGHLFQLVGEYPTHCCLGILCEELGLSHGPSPYNINETRKSVGFLIDGCTHRHTLPEELLKEVGLTPQQHLLCLNWNDGTQLSFAQIADNIEQQF